MLKYTGNECLYTKNDEGEAKMLKPWEYLGNRVVVVCKDGYTVAGKCDCYLSAADNEPDPEAIVVGSEEIPIKDIAHISIQ